ncbi:Hypothetical predicted protein [Cloeon dipterum]|uniref:Uncharacterized protein n=1 Tax=Cloeon dipterum TaxID=197152 RepID=A0A8S1CCH4_9INSE|nr:Hypothetical predicted protein [Cloeon dipterum]
MPTVISPDLVFADLVKALFNNEDHLDDSYIKYALEEAFSPNMTELDFAKVMDLFPENYPQIIDVFTSITSRASNILILKITEGMLAERNFNSMSMDVKMVEAIGRMSKLIILKVQRFYLSFSKLIDLCRKLPWLKILFFKIEPEPEFEVNDIENFEQCFGNLEIFQFTPASNDRRLNSQFQQTLTLECISTLPNLRILGDPDDKYFVDMLQTCLESNELAGDNNWISKLTHLTLFLGEDVPENALNIFPDVTQLHIWVGNNQENNTGYLVTGLLDFQHLSKLTMCELGMNYSHYIKCFLDVYGRRLKHLILNFKSYPINFVWLFNTICCNNLGSLQELVMCNLDIQPPSMMVDERGCDAAVELGRLSYESLRELQLEFACKKTFSQAYVELSKILSVPNLEGVRLIRVPTTLDELWETMILVTERKILKKVTYFVLELFDEQIIENEIIARARCCQTIKDKLLSNIEEVEKFVEVTIYTPPPNFQPFFSKLYNEI